MRRENYISVAKKRKTSTLSSETHLLQSEKDAPGIFRQDEKQERASFLFSEVKSKLSEISDKEQTGHTKTYKREQNGQKAKPAR